jgi:peptidoglycan/xylan/chitin deacetylase (PgdA/CDA1 family)
MMINLRIHTRICIWTIAIIFFLSANNCIKSDELIELQTVLPEKLLLTPDIFTEEMDALTGWTTNAATIMVLNEKEKHSGSASILLTSAPGAIAQLNKTVTWDFSNDKAGSFSIWVCPHSDPLTTFAGITLYCANEASFTNYFTSSITTLNSNLKQNQWNQLMTSWVVAAGNPDWAKISHFRIKVSPKVGQISQCSFDLIGQGSTKKHSALIMFDDGYESTYSLAYPLMKARNMVGTVYSIPDRFGVDGYMTVSQLKELYANNWDIGNHTKTHAHLADLNLPEIVTELEDCKTILDGLGLTRASNHVAYPFGEASFTVLAAMKSWGAKTGRGWNPIISNSSHYDYWWPYRINWRDPGTLDQVKTVIDNSVKENAQCVLVFHNLVTGVLGRYEWNISDFESILDYLISQNVQTLTIDEYYRLYSGPITVTHK